MQGTVEAALAELLPDPVRIDAAGRTDRGVHATGQEIAFGAPRRWRSAEMRRALNAVLPSDVWLERCGEAPAEFHPRFDARGRRYLYLVAVDPDASSPLRRGRVWQLGREPDAALLRDAAASLPGERSFEAFAKSGQPERGARCRVESAGWRRTVTGELAFTVVADRFLHHMVRYLVRTMVEVGLNDRGPDAIARMLAEPGGANGKDAEGDDAGGASDGPRPPAPAPAEGLYLTGVRYEDGWNRPGGVPGLALPGEPT